MNIKKRAYYSGILFMIPALFIFTMFFYYPFILSIFYSFTDWNAVRKPHIVGFLNYINFFHDPHMLQGLKNTLMMVVFGLLVQNPIALCLAVLLNRKWRTRAFLRIAFYLPVIISLVVTSVVWSQILQFDGVLNTVLTKVGLGSIVHDWLGTIQTVFPTIILMSQWQAIGFCAIIYLAGLQSIPIELYEAAAIEGARGWKLFRYITLPMLMSSVTIVVFLTVVGALKLFDLPFLLTNGGPGNASYTLFLATYYSAFRDSDYGYGSAAGIILSIFIISVVVVQLSITRRREVEL